MNEVIQSIHNKYAFDKSQDYKFISQLKVLESKNGELISKDILKAALGEEKFEELSDIILENKEATEKRKLSEFIQ